MATQRGHTPMICRRRQRTVPAPAASGQGAPTSQRPQDRTRRTKWQVIEDGALAESRIHSRLSHDRRRCVRSGDLHIERTMRRTRLQGTAAAAWLARLRSGDNQAWREVRDGWPDSRPVILAALEDRDDVLLERALEFIPGLRSCTKTLAKRVEALLKDGSRSDFIKFGRGNALVEIEETEAGSAIRPAVVDYSSG